MLVVIVRDGQTPLFFLNQNFQSSVSSLGLFRVTPN